MSYKLQMRHLIDLLNEASESYENGNPLMDDAYWDDLYFELEKLEKENGFSFPDSPTQQIYYTLVSELEKVEHNHPMLSLEKTKEVEVIKSFTNGQDCIAMCKMDGLTCSLTYENGILVKAETRGNGLVGENIYHNALVIPSIPKAIKHEGKLIVDGEIICKYDDFKSFENTYKNPRNFAAGSIRLLDSKECSSRKLTFVAWEVIEGLDKIEKLSTKLNILDTLNFTVVPWVKDSVDESIITLKQCAINESYPIDGLVFKYDNIAYGKSLGKTDHHFKNAKAFKFYDEVYGTTLIDIIYDVSRNGKLTPVAVFEPVDCEGSIVEKASVHNLTMLEKIFHGTPWKGQQIQIYKANEIIPQVLSAEEPVFDNYDYINIPTTCPVCGGQLKVLCEIDSEFLICTNPNCERKLINQLDHALGKTGLDIKGLSKATLEKLIMWGWVESLEDIFNLKRYRNEWIKISGFGVKSVDNILNAIEEAKVCNLDQYIVALGIPLIGRTAAKELIKNFPTWTDFINAIKSDFKFFNLPNFGPEMHLSLINFDYTEADKIANNYLTFTKQYNSIQDIKIDKIICITGKLKKFKNRDELVSTFESLGGKVTSSVSKNTDYLVNNDSTSESSKNLNAKRLNIPIITEDEFIEIFNINF